MAYSGLFRPKHPQKYVGDYKNIVYRSSWEARFMHKFDVEEWVIAWSSEEVFVPYISPLDGKFHRYFPDFVIKVKNQSGEIETWMIEVKPKKQTIPPERKKRVTKQYINEVTTWGVNQSKWKYAKEYCEDRNWKFIIFTEDQLPKI
jgi:hypothetical protein